MEQFRFDPTNLKLLVESSGLTCDEVARRCGISNASLSKYLRGETIMGVENAVLLADFFAVPLDVLVGRCDEKTSKKILDKYSKYFMKLRRVAYEDYLIKGRVASRDRLNANDVLLPWPYNIMDEVLANAVYGEKPDIDFIVSKEHEQKIVSIIDGLQFRKGNTVTMSDCLLMKYRDGMTLQAIAKQVGLTSERVRQIVARGIRILRHHPLKDWFLYGEEYYTKNNSLAKKEFELSLKDKRLTIWENELIEKEKSLYKRERACWGR